MALTEARLTQGGGMRGMQAGANRVLQSYVVPGAAFFSDDFNRTNGALGSSWAVTTGSILISTNKAVPTSNSAVDQAWAVVPGISNDQWCEADFVAGDTYSWINVRGDDAHANFYQFVCGRTLDGGKWTLGKGVAGSESDIIVGANGTGVTGKYRLEVQGSNIRAYINNVKVADVTDTQVTTGRIGFGYYTTATGVASTDNFRGGDLPYTAPPSTWTYDFTDDANGDPTGWTTVGGLEVGNATVLSGMYRCPQNWWNSTTRMDTPTLTTNRRRITAEFVWDATDSAIEVGIRNLDGSLKNSVSLEAAGNWAGISQGGFDGANGTYTAPGIGTPFTVEWTWYGGPTGAGWVHAVGSVKINGVTIGSSVFNNVFTPATGIYATVFMKGTAGLRKIRYEDPDATLPAVFTDNFDRVNGAIGADWAGSWNVATNKAVRDTTEFVRYAVPMPTADHWIEADVDIQSQFLVLNARGQDVLGADCYQGFIDAGTGQAKIGMMSGGSYSDVNPGTTGLGTGPYKGRLEVQGTAIRFYRNGTLVASATHSTQTTGRYVGFNASGSIGSMDNFRAGPLPYVP